MLLETLRIFPPVTGIPKIASYTAPTLRLGDQILVIPPGTEVFPLLLGVYTDARYWDDPYIWRPSRWILPDDKGDEELLIPRRGAFFPWLEGPQIFVGKKFSLVEGVAVLACYALHTVGYSLERLVLLLLTPPVSDSADTFHYFLDMYSYLQPSLSMVPARAMFLPNPCLTAPGAWKRVLGG